MGRLIAEFSPAFRRDLKKLEKRHVNDEPLEHVIDLIFENSPRAWAELEQRHKMHRLFGAFSGAFECHVCNCGNWLLIWKVAGKRASFIRTETHDELFRH